MTSMLVNDVTMMLVNVGQYCSVSKNYIMNIIFWARWVMQGQFNVGQQYISLLTNTHVTKHKETDT